MIYVRKGGEERINSCHDRRRERTNKTRCSLSETTIDIVKSAHRLSSQVFLPVINWVYVVFFLAREEIKLNYEMSNDKRQKLKITGMLHRDNKATWIVDREMSRKTMRQERKRVNSMESATRTDCTISTDVGGRRNWKFTAKMLTPTHETRRGEIMMIYGHSSHSHT
jgi:hypothetical protein